MPQITVEFFGIPQTRIGCAKLTVDAETIGDVLQRLSDHSEAFRQSCLHDKQLRPEFLISVNGKEFTRDPSFTLHASDTLLILNADVGG